MSQGAKDFSLEKGRDRVGKWKAPLHLQRKLTRGFLSGLKLNASECSAADPDYSEGGLRLLFAYFLSFGEHFFRIFSSASDGSSTPYLSKIFSILVFTGPLSKFFQNLSRRSLADFG